MHASLIKSDCLLSHSSVKFNVRFPQVATIPSSGYLHLHLLLVQVLKIERCANYLRNWRLVQVLSIQVSIQFLHAILQFILLTDLFVFDNFQNLSYNNYYQI